MRENTQFFLTQIVLLAVLFGIPLLASFSEAQAKPSNERPEAWAKPLHAPGLPNLHRVTDNLYRSAQPTAEGMANAEKLGVKTVLSLRAFHGDNRVTKDTGLEYRRIPINTWNIDESEIQEALAAITSGRGGPFLVHCQHGADRTGLLIASYRIVIQGWSKEAAFDELQNGGYGYHAIWKNIPTFIEKMDVDAWREKLSLPATEDVADEFTLEAA